MIPTRIRILTFLGYVLVLVALSLTAGCAAQEVRREALEVKVGVPVACVVEMPQEPAWAVDQLPRGADDFALAKAYRAERRQREQYVREAQAAVAACKKKGTP